MRIDVRKTSSTSISPTPERGDLKRALSRSEEFLLGIFGLEPGVTQRELVSAYRLLKARHDNDILTFFFGQEGLSTPDQKERDLLKLYYSFLKSELGETAKAHGGTLLEFVLLKYLHLKPEDRQKTLGAIERMAMQRMHRGAIAAIQNKLEPKTEMSSLLGFDKIIELPNVPASHYLQELSRLEKNFFDVLSAVSYQPGLKFLLASFKNWTSLEEENPLEPPDLKEKLSTLTMRISEWIKPPAFAYYPQFTNRYDPTFTKPAPKQFVERPPSPPPEQPKELPKPAKSRAELHKELTSIITEVKNNRRELEAKLKDRISQLEAMEQKSGPEQPQPEREIKPVLQTSKPEVHRAQKPAVPAVAYPRLRSSHLIQTEIKKLPPTLQWVAAEIFNTLRPELKKLPNAVRNEIEKDFLEMLVKLNIPNLQDLRALERVEKIKIAEKFFQSVTRWNIITQASLNFFRSAKAPNVPKEIIQGGGYPAIMRTFKKEFSSFIKMENIIPKNLKYEPNQILAAVTKTSQLFAESPTLSSKADALIRQTVIDAIRSFGSAKSGPKIELRVQHYIDTFTKRVDSIEKMLLSNPTTNTAATPYAEKLKEDFTRKMQEIAHLKGVIRRPTLETTLAALFTYHRSQTRELEEQSKTLSNLLKSNQADAVLNLLGFEENDLAPEPSLSR